MGQAHTERSRTLTLPILLFQGGTHGNFLSRCLSVSSGIEQDFDFFHETIGAHANWYFQRLVDHLHPQQLDEDVVDILCYIHVKQSDLYFVNSHVYKSAGDFNLDVLRIKDFDDITSVIESKPWHPVVTEVDLENKVNSFKDSGISGLREMFKLSFRSLNGIIQQQQQDYEKFTIANQFEFEWFYNYDDFKHNLIKLLKILGKEYCYDIEHHWQDFINQKQQIMLSKQEVELAMECFVNNSNMDISNFCFYQQGYLDHLVEQYLGYEIELWHDGYPQNMCDYDPVQATGDNE